MAQKAALVTHDAALGHEAALLLVHHPEHPQGARSCRRRARARPAEVRRRASASRAGYPDRLPFIEFCLRYEVLAPGIIFLPPGYVHGRKACLRMVDALELYESIFRIGTPKIFFKAGVRSEGARCCSTSSRDCRPSRASPLPDSTHGSTESCAACPAGISTQKKEGNSAAQLPIVMAVSFWVRTLLAATRNNDELRRKEAELILAEERAVRGQREREALESVNVRNVKATRVSKSRPTTRDSDGGRGPASPAARIDRPKKQLQGEVNALKERLYAEILAKNDEIAIKRSLQARLQRLEITSSATATIHSELQEAIDAYKTKTDEYLKRYEEVEIKPAKAARAEPFARRALADAEKARAEAELERKLEEDRESSDLAFLRQRLAEEMKDEGKQHQQDIAKRDYAVDQTGKKHQAELAQLSEELQSQRDTMSRLREESRRLRSEYDELQLRYDDEVYTGGSWKKDKERLGTKIQDVTKAYDASVAAQAEQQSQIVSLHSQARELRSVLNDAETDRTLLPKARRALQAELEAIKMDHVDTNRMSSDTEVQRLRLEKQDLERSLEEQGDRVSMAFERMKKAESYANECQIELEKIRVENSELDKMNANLEKQVKDLNLRIVDLETRSLNAPRPATGSRRLESRIEELTSQLSQSTKDTSRIHRTTDKALHDSERQRSRLEEEVKNYESKIVSMRQTMDELQTSENNLQLAKRRAEREAADFKQKSLNLEREVERLRSRLERPSSTLLGSPVSSPRKL
ncbi:hypothetical protein BD311DRAFT_869504 [Dichomitus squalens]|uniref:Uncharacterized protein n=1 Tax=Dichomitus squalens TaxID=114155 RepID=A0A4Q9M5Q0_9APHY|nr:hypothetical protein BD311DRAFT_869504 [Dichomitus squalens]